MATSRDVVVSTPTNVMRRRQECQVMMIHSSSVTQASVLVQAQTQFVWTFSHLLVRGLLKEEVNE